MKLSKEADPKRTNWIARLLEKRKSKVAPTWKRTRGKPNAKTPSRGMQIRLKTPLPKNSPKVQLDSKPTVISSGDWVSTSENTAPSLKQMETRKTPPQMSLKATVSLEFHSKIAGVLENCMSALAGALENPVPINAFETKPTTQPLKTVRSWLTYRKARRKFKYKNALSTKWVKKA